MHNERKLAIAGATAGISGGQDTFRPGVEYAVSKFAGANERGSARSWGAGMRAGLSAARRSLHLVSVVLPDGVAMAEILRGDTGLLDLGGVVVQMGLSIITVTPVRSGRMWRLSVDSRGYRDTGPTIRRRDGKVKVISL